MVDIPFTVGELRRVAVERLEREWLGSEIWIRSRTYRLAECEILVAEHGEGLLAYDVRDRPIAELVAVNAFKRYQGIGTALLNCLVRRLRANGFATIRLGTTNDNLDALRFYQRRGFRMAALRPNAVDDARKLKPSIPMFGAYGLPVRDEIDLILNLSA